MITKDLVTLVVKSEGVDKVTVDFDKIAKGVKEIELEAKDAKGAIQSLKNENKNLSEGIKREEKTIKSLSKELKELAKSGDTSSKKVESLAQSQENARIRALGYRNQIQKNNESIKQAGYVQEYLTRTMKVSDMTMTQLSRRAEYLRDKLNNLSKSKDKVEWNKYNDQLIEVEKQQKKVAAGGDQVKSRFDSIGNTIKKVLPLMIAYAALRIFQNILSGAVEWIKKAPEVAAKAEGVVRAFGKLNNTGLLSTLRKETKGLISDLVLMQSSVRADRFGIPINNLAKYLKFAQQRAQETGQSVDYLAESIINGIGRKSPLILDNLGISAARLKAEMKGGADIVQATTKIVEEELKKQGDLSLTSADKATQASVKWENAQLKVGNRLKWLSDKWNEFSGSLADSVANMAGDSRTLTERYDDQIKKVADLEVNTVRLMPRYTELSKKARLTKDEHKELDGILQQVARTMPIAVTEWDKYGNAVAISTEKVHSFIRAEQIRLKLMYEDKLKEKREQLVDYVSEFEELQEKIDALNSGETLKKWQGSITSVSSGAAGGSLVPLTDEEVIAIRKRYAKVKALMLETNEEIDYMNGSSYKKEVGFQIKTEEKRNEFYKMEKKALKQWIEDRKNANSEYLELAQQIYTQKFGGEYGSGKEEKESKILARQKKEYDLLMEGLETKHQDRLAEIKKKYASGEIETEAEYNQLLFAENQAYFLIQQEALAKHLDKLKKEKVKNTSLESDIVKKQAELNRQSLDQQIKFQSALEKILLDADPLAKEEKEYKERLRALGIFTTDRQTLLMNQIDAQSEEEKQKIQKQLDALEVLEKQYRSNIKKIRDDAAREADKTVDDKYKALRDQLRKQVKILENEAGLLNDLTGDNSSIGKIGSAFLGVESDAEQKALDKKMELHRQDLQIVQEKIEARRKAGQEYEDLRTEQETIEQQILSVEEARLMKMAKLYNDLGQQIGNTFGEILTGQKSLLEGIGSLLTDFVFDTLTAVVNAKVAEMTAVAVAAQAKMAVEAFATTDSVLTFGASGAARIAVIGGLITGALAAGKAALKGMLNGGGSSGKSSSSNTSYRRVVSGKESGGRIDVARAQDGKHFSAIYDPYKRGFVDGPTVIVGEGPAGRSKEWVASNDAINNPTIRPIIDLIDSEQRAGTVSTLDLNRLIRAQMAGLATGGFVSRPALEGMQGTNRKSVGTVTEDNTELNNTLLRLDQVLRVLEKTGVNLNYRKLETTQDTMNQINKMSSRS